MLCTVPTTSRNTPGLPEGTITLKASYANENDTTFDLSFHSQLAQEKAFILKLPNNVQNEIC